MITVANKYIEKFVQNQLFGNSYQNIHAMTGKPDQCQQILPDILLSFILRNMARFQFICNARKCKPSNKLLKQIALSK